MSLPTATGPTSDDLGVSADHAKQHGGVPLVAPTDVHRLDPTEHDGSLTTLGPVAEALGR